MNQFEQFQNSLIIKNISENNFALEPDLRYFVGNTPHGGYLMAIMHKALVSSLPHSTAISSSVQYLERIEAKEITLKVEILKISRGSSSGIVKIVQDKINLKKKVFPKIKNLSKIEEKMSKVNNQELKSSLNNFIKAFNERNK